MNGVLKQEYGLGERFRSQREVLSAVREAVGLYNGYRPHGALGYRTPDEVHGGGGGRGPGVVMPVAATAGWGGPRPPGNGPAAPGPRPQRMVIEGQTEEGCDNF